jgi:hypothetical protein
MIYGSLTSNYLLQSSVKGYLIQLNLVSQVMKCKYWKRTFILLQWTFSHF